MTSIVVGNNDFRAALASVKAHAGKGEKEHPMYKRVRMIIDPTNTTIVATDGSSVGLAIVSVWEHVDPSIEIIDLLVDDAERILGIFPPVKELDEEESAPTFTLRIDIASNHIQVTDDAGMFDGRSLRVPRLDTDANYTDIPLLLSKAHHAAPSLLEDMVANGALLSRFKTASQIYKVPLQIEAHVGFSSLLIRAGESFLGLLMPRNLSGDEERQRKEWALAWSTRLPDPASTAADSEAS